MSDVIDTLNAQEMVDQANALLDRNRELQAEIDRLLRVNSEKHKKVMELHERVQEMSKQQQAGRDSETPPSTKALLTKEAL